MTETILAIDASLTNTAVCIGTAASHEIKTFSSTQAEAVADRIARYKGMCSSITEWLIKNNAWKPRAIFIEDYSFGSKGSAVTQIAEYGGRLRECLLDVCPRLFEVAPLTLKKFVTGKGAGKKEHVIAHIVKRYGLMFDTNDEYDAFGLYRLGLVAEGLVEADNQAQREAANTVLGIKNVKPKKKATAKEVARELSQHFLKTGQFDTKM